VFSWRLIQVPLIYLSILAERLKTSLKVHKMLVGLARTPALRVGSAFLVTHYAKDGYI
jgi:hypothetical protein